MDNVGLIKDDFFEALYDLDEEIEEAKKEEAQKEKKDS